jgi:CBS domain-containing protein
MIESGAGAIVVVDPDNKPVGLAEEAAVAAVPEARRPWVAVSNVSRALDPRAVLPVTLTGEPLLQALDAYVAREYLVVDESGLVYGVLTRTDVERALGLPASN